MNLIIVEKEEASPAGHLRLTDARARHLRDVLRVTAGQSVRLGMLDGPMGVATVTRVSDDAVDLRYAFDHALPPRPAVDLLLALPRPKVLRRLWAQLSALGVGQIILTNAERVERHYFDTHVVTADCYRPLLIEGLQQARDTWLPRVSIHRRFKVLVEDALDGLFPNGRRLVAHPGALDSAVDAGRSAWGTRILLAIGPEGGWNAFELELLAAHGFAAVGMGPRTLRTDTACLALLALVHAGMQEPPGPIKITS